MASLLASIPLQLVCQLLVTGSQEPTNPPQLVTESPPNSKPVGPIFPEGYIAYPNIGFAYRIYNDSVRWNVARKNCEAEGANLAVIDSWKKFDYISRQRQSKGLTHVGIHDLYEENEWVSVKNGSTLNVIPWANGEPTTNGGAHCVMVKNQSGGLGNFGCGNFLADFVCEIPITDDRDKSGNQPLTQIIPN